MRGHIDQRPPGPDVGRIAPDHAGVLLDIMAIPHTEPVARAFDRLLTKSLEPDDHVHRAHLIPVVLLFDAFAFDLYWDELREDIGSLRMQSGNDKCCENFEIAADAVVDRRRLL